MQSGEWWELVNTSSADGLPPHSLFSPALVWSSVLCCTVLYCAVLYCNVIFHNTPRQTAGGHFTALLQISDQWSTATTSPLTHQN